MLKYIIPILFLTVSCTTKPGKDGSPPTNSSAASPTTFVVSPSPTSTPSNDVKEPERVQEDLNNTFQPPDNWREVKNEMWRAYFPNHIELKKDNVYFLAQVFEEDRSFMFYFDGVNKVYRSANEATVHLIKSLKSKNVEVTLKETINVNGKLFNVLHSTGAVGDQIMVVDLYVSNYNDMTYVFSCGGDSFSDKDRNLCHKIISTLKLNNNMF